jgi:hypothetical protein
MRTIIIKINQPLTDRMGSSIEALIEVLDLIYDTKPGDSLTLDLSDLCFVHPFLILPVSALIKYLRKIGVRVLLELPKNRPCFCYLKNIFFEEGISPLIHQEWEKKLNDYNYKNYLPIISVPTTSVNEIIKNKILSTFENILQNQLMLEINVQIAIKFIIGESFDNIDQHSNVENGWIMVQNYPDKEYLDVCIADTGKGLLQSYKDADFKNITTHEQALNEAINGRSTKIYEKSRGYGIRTSKKMLVEGLKGKYFLYSGTAFYIWTDEHKNISPLNERFFWPGTLLALRIPKKAPLNFKYSSYLE